MNNPEPARAEIIEALKKRWEQTGDLYNHDELTAIFDDFFGTTKADQPTAEFRPDPFEGRVILIKGAPQSDGERKRKRQLGIIHNLFKRAA